jgi:AcrR family transcriptional regulator
VSEPQPGEEPDRAPADEPRRRRLEPDERRRQILACAVRLFGERPYADVSTTDVARAAGVARGLVNHYFGTKKGLYVEVVRTLVTIPAVAAEAIGEAVPGGDLVTRIDAGVAWFLDVVSRHRRSWLAAMAAGGGQDPQVAAVLAEADEVTADTLLRLLGLDGVAHPAREELRAMFRAYGGLGKAAAREWLEHGALDRTQTHRLLTSTLLAIVRPVVQVHVHAVPPLPPEPLPPEPPPPEAGQPVATSSPDAGATRAGSCPVGTPDPPSRRSTTPGAPRRTNHSRP